MSNVKDGQEPSMEDILSSIRRIIADDQDEPAAKPAAAVAKPKAPPPPVIEEADDELELTDTVSQPVPPPAPKRKVEPEIPQMRVAAKREERPKMPVADDEDLLAKGAAQASTSALARLTRAVAPEDRQGIVSGAGGMTIDQLVVDLLKPQLKDWLEQHLPGIVERVVEQEVKKLARRAELL